MQEHADARKSTQQCQQDQLRLLKMLEEALLIKKLVEQHDIEIKEFRDDHAKLKESVESLKSPLQTLIKKIDSIELTTTAISPLLKNYNFVQGWSIRVSYAVTACVIVYFLFGSNAVKLFKLILTTL